MSSKWIKEHLSLIAGLTLPIALMLVFAISNLPFLKAEPPHYDLLFSIMDTTNTPSSIQAKFVVKDDMLFVQYNKVKNNSYWGIQRLYFFDAKTQKIRELPLEQPSFNEHSEFKENIVKATDKLKLDTSLESPDGYTLYTDNNNYSSGLLSDFFLGSNSRSNGLCLRKNLTCIQLFNIGDGRNFYSNNVQFIGWVKP